MEFINKSEAERALDFNSALRGLVEYCGKHGPIEYLVCLGHNWEYREKRELYPHDANPETTQVDSSQLELSLPSKITAVVSFLLLQLGIVKKIIFSGGRTAGPTQLSEAAAMSEYILSFFGEIFFNEFKDKIILEEVSHTTYSNMQQVKEILGKESTNLGLMSIGYHMDIRAKSISRANDMPFRVFINSDDILRDLVKILDNPVVLNQNESFELPVGSWDIKWRMITLLGEYMRYFSNPFFIGRKNRIQMISHGPVYHYLARLFQLLSLDPTGQKIDRKAAGRLSDGEI